MEGAAAAADSGTARTATRRLSLSQSARWPARAERGPLQQAVPPPSRPLFRPAHLALPQLAPVNRLEEGVAHDICRARGTVPAGRGVQDAF